MREPVSDYRQGLLHAFLAYAVWGLLPAYIKLLGGVSALEIVANRVIWSLGIILAILVWRRQLAGFLAVLSTPRMLAALSLSAVLIAINWLAYIWAVVHGHVLAASLGYFLNPLVNVLIGVTLLHDRLSRVQWCAIGLAACGVAILAAGAPDTLGISLALALSFAFYGLVRKLTPVSALVGLAVETLVLLVPAIAAFVWVQETSGVSFGQDIPLTALLVATGVVTSVPLLLFASAARRLSMVTLGLIQYVAPTLQFLLGVFVYGERLSVDRWASFGLVWAGLALFMGHALRQRGRPATV